MDMPSTPSAVTNATGLLLTGGGARAAYQVGVLEAIAAIRASAGQQRGPNPFGVITGTSAGAINAAALACRADDFDGAVNHIAQVWRHMRSETIYRADALSMLGAQARWRLLLGFGQLLGHWLRQHPRSLLDNRPLAQLLADMVPLERLPQLLDQGQLQALAVTASSYSSGEHVTFFQSAVTMQPWVRSQRIAVPEPISHQHLLASSAIPFVFPAVGLPVGQHTEYFGDGSMRQTAPIAAAIHLGARRILVVGASRLHEPQDMLAPNTHTGYPSLAQIAGHAMSSIFLDALSVDVERLERINHTLALIPPERLTQSTLRPLELLVIAPSERVDAIAQRHVQELPRPLQRLFGGLAAGEAEHISAKAAALASYLLFESSFTRELMALGRFDTLARRSQVCRFFGWPDDGMAAGTPAQN